MPVKVVVALTDPEWFEHLRRKPDLAEVNFWSPSGRAFRALAPGEVFLFRLHAPFRAIVGGGIFAHADTFPCSLAWEAFGEANGAAPSPKCERESRVTGRLRPRSGLILLSAAASSRSRSFYPKTTGLRRPIGRLKPGLQDIQHR
jgi:hypothetical protein